MSNDMDKDKDLTQDQAKALAEGLRESAILREQLDELRQQYRALDRKHPLKSKSKYSD